MNIEDSGLEVGVSTCDRDVVTLLVEAVILTGLAIVLPMKLAFALTVSCRLLVAAPVLNEMFRPTWLCRFVVMFRGVLGTGFSLVLAWLRLNNAVVTRRLLTLLAIERRTPATNVVRLLPRLATSSTLYSGWVWLKLFLVTRLVTAKIGCTALLGPGMSIYCRRQLTLKPGLTL